MSTGSNGTRNSNRRLENVQQRGRVNRQASNSLKTSVTRYDAYTFALRAAYLAHLLQPRVRKFQPRPQVQRTSTSVADLVRDFSLVRDSKSTRFPHGFTVELDKRITGVLMGKERMPEFADSLVKTTFAAFLNEFKKPEFRRSMEKDRRVEDLILIFFSSATKQLQMQKSKAQDDDSWKLLVDRHVALFVRLLGSTLKGNDWARERPELSSRLQTLESKLLTHDQVLATGGGVETEVSKSQDVRDMPLVQTVSIIFGRSVMQVQSDIDEQKDLWTEKAGMLDLKLYQTNMSMNTKRTLRSDDFDTEDAYETWKKAEMSEISQMITTIIQSNPELAKNAPRTVAQDYPLGGPTVEHNHPAHSRRSSELEPLSPYVIDLPVDMSVMDLDDHSNDEAKPDQGEPYIFIPPEPRPYYRFVIQEALAYDMKTANLDHVGGDPTDQPLKTLLSQRSIELLSEVGLRWRIPYVSRSILFLDVMREKFVGQKIDSEVVDAAFTWFKNPPAERKKGEQPVIPDPTKWTITDYVLKQQILISIHDMLLRDLYAELQKCYEAKPPDIGIMMAVLEQHIYDDPLFSKTPEDLDQFGRHLQNALEEKSKSIYQEIYDSQIQSNKDRLEFYHIVQLGKEVLKLCEKTQKRYRKTSRIMGAEPFTALVQTVLPSLAADSRDQIILIQDQAEKGGEQIATQDGFDLYKEMVQIRRVHEQVLPNVRFNFDIEGLLATFVWRLIQMTDDKTTGWVEEAVKHDNFKVEAQNTNVNLTDDQRHSVSVVDVFRSFNQAVDQVNQLNWDDDLQYSQFMTALSKAFGAGLARYCELLEQIFVKEMDRLSPEQEMALTQSRQEKWMQMAKEAMSTKEKVEPFQFFSESFVKLNNVEYAMLQLDKLQKDMNADACAEVIRKQKPTTNTRRRGPEKNVFSIKIVEAEDLKACDMNGLSDPYVVLVDEMQKRLAKTRIIYGNLNPRWDETIEILSQGPVNIVATIWDWDVMGDHDCVGRTTIKLDPAHFKDFMPREYWLELDTQGRLLVRISMEGEKDDIQFYFGKAFRALKRTERDMSKKITDKLSAYIHYCLSKRALKSLTAKPLSISSVSSFLGRRPQSMIASGPAIDVAGALKPLFSYLNENFAIMNVTLTSTALIKVMTRVWKEVLLTIESLLVPPLSPNPSPQRPLNRQELDLVFKWLELLFDFFHAVDDETGLPGGVPLDILKSPKYHDLQNLNFFYYEDSDVLIRTSERMVSDASQSQQQQRIPRVPVGAGELMPTASLARRSKSIMLSRNLGTMKKVKEEKRKEAQAEPSDDIILRILRMRPEAARYLRDRQRQKERLAAQAAAEAIVRASMGPRRLGDER